MECGIKEENDRHDYLFRNLGNRPSFKMDTDLSSTMEATASQSTSLSSGCKRRISTHLPRKQLPSLEGSTGKRNFLTILTIRGYLMNTPNFTSRVSMVRMRRLSTGYTFIGILFVLMMLSNSELARSQACTVARPGNTCRIEGPTGTVLNIGTDCLWVVFTISNDSCTSPCQSNCYCSATISWPDGHSCGDITQPECCGCGTWLGTSTCEGCLCPGESISLNLDICPGKAVIATAQSVCTH
jgi:hypothetical protein